MASQTDHKTHVYHKRREQSNAEVITRAALWLNSCGRMEWNSMCQAPGLFPKVTLSAKELRRELLGEITVNDNTYKVYYYHSIWKRLDET